MTWNASTDSQSGVAAYVITATGFTLTFPSALQDGSHTIVVSMTDRAGNATSAQGAFRVDTSTWVKITQPDDRAVLNVLTTTVAGQAEPGAQVTLNTGGQTYGPVLAQDSTFRLENVALAWGDNVLVARAVDPVGNSAAFTITVTADPNRPSAGVSAVPPVFSPNGDGIQDVTTFVLTTTAAPAME